MFKNEYILNKKLIKEYVLSILCKDIIVVGIILVIISLLLFFLDTTLYIYLVMSCLITLFMLFCPVIMINNLEDNAKRLNNGRIEKTVVEFSNNIVMNEGKVHLEFEYSQVKKIKDTKSFIVLMIGHKSAILVYKDGFTKGNKNDYMEFIYSKLKKC